ncbi:MAG: hypothetical protein ACREUY_01835 [Burkholderiales bacterium]
MKFSADDFKALRVPLFILMAVLIAGVSLVYYTRLAVDTTLRDLRQQQNLLREARTRYQKSGDEKELIVSYLGDYQRLQQLGLIGSEQRINWLDGLRLANQQAELFGVEYKIGSQQPYAQAQEFNPGNVAIRQSPMKLTFSMLHEGDLMRFFNILSNKGIGLFQLNQCNLERVTNNVTSIRFQPNLRAECELSWFTLVPPEPRSAKP